MFVLRLTRGSVHAAAQTVLLHILPSRNFGALAASHEHTRTPSPLHSTEQCTVNKAVISLKVDDLLKVCTMQFPEAVQHKKTQQDSFGEEEWMNGED